MPRIKPDSLELKDRVVHINRVTKVVKGGKNFRFSALVVVGDGRGHVGYGAGKAKEVPQAIAKGIERAKRNLIRIPLKGNTIPHPVLGIFGAGPDPVHVVASRRRRSVRGFARRAVRRVG